jgi:hypothetical protein
MADVVALAGMWWDVAMNDPSFAAELQADRTRLLKAVKDGTNVGDIINGSKNGAQYTQAIAFRLEARITAIHMAAQGLDNGRRPSRNQQIRFSC